MRMRLLLVLVLISLLAAACGETTADAATVDGESIERSYLEEELRALMANEAYRSQVAAAQGESPDEPSTLTEQSVPSGLSAFWLSRLIFQAVVDAELGERGVEATDEHRARAVENINAEFGPEVLSEFPEWFQDRLVERTANFTALGEAMAPPPPSDEDIEEFFEINREFYEAECPSQRNVSHILLDNEEEARAVIDELESGADFAEVATERSTDPSATANGGALGCVDQAFVPEFADAAAAAALGEPTGPAESDFGFHVILVEEAPVTLEALGARVEADLLAQSADPFTPFFDERFTVIDVTVDPRFGSWVAAGSSSRVEAPLPPEVRDGRESDDDLGEPIVLPEG